MTNSSGYSKIKNYNFYCFEKQKFFDYVTNRGFKPHDLNKFCTKIDNTFIFAESEFAVAGGALRDSIDNKPYKDIDLFPTSSLNHEKLIDDMKMTSFGFEKKSEFATNFKNENEKAQIISPELFGWDSNTTKRFIHQLFSEFDFTINQFAYVLSSGKFFIGHKTLSDIRSKLLRLVNTDNIKHTQITKYRIINFCNRGYGTCYEQEKEFLAIEQGEAEICSCGKNHNHIPNHYYCL